MEEGINVFDDFEDEFSSDFGNNEYDVLQQEEEESNDVIDSPPTEIKENDNNEEDYITEFLKFKNIVNSDNKVKYMNDEGETEEVEWNSLSKEDKVNILKSIESMSEPELDDTEIELINTIRTSKMTPSEYLKYIEKTGVDNYVKNATVPQYKIDDMSDDELYMLDLMVKMEDLSNEEVEQALESEKSNPTLFSKKMESLRKEYKQAEQEKIEQEQFEAKQAAQEQYALFSNSIQNEITEFKDFYGCEIDMDKDEMNNLYEFITGFDAAGNNHFAKALQDPNLVVKMAWTILNGESLISDIDNHYKSWVSKVREESYKKGLEDAKKETNTVSENKPKVIIKPQSNQVITNDDGYFELNEF